MTTNEQDAITRLTEHIETQLNGLDQAIHQLHLIESHFPPNKLVQHDLQLLIQNSLAVSANLSKLNLYLHELAHPAKTTPTIHTNPSRN